METSRSYWKPAGSPARDPPPTTSGRLSTAIGKAGIERLESFHPAATQEAGAPKRHLIVTLSVAASEAAQSKGPPMERCAPLREARILTCGDLSTRSRTLSLKMTCGNDSEGGASPTLLSENPDFWRSSGRAGIAIVPTMPIRLRLPHRTMASRATPAVHRSGAPLHATMQAAGAPSARSQSFNHPSRDRADGATLGSLPLGGDSEGRRSGTPRSRSPSANRISQQHQPSASVTATTRETATVQCPHGNPPHRETRPMGLCP